MADVGKVRFWVLDQGWGVIDSGATPGGCWVHFSAVAVPGFRRLEPGAEVELEWEAASQDGYSFRATTVWPRGREPEWPPTADDLPALTSAYRSSVTIEDYG